MRLFFYIANAFFAFFLANRFLQRVFYEVGRFNDKSKEYKKHHHPSDQQHGVLLNCVLQRLAAHLVQATIVCNRLSVHTKRRRSLQTAFPRIDVIVLVFAADGEVLTRPVLRHRPLLLFL